MLVRVLLACCGCVSAGEVEKILRGKTAMRHEWDSRTLLNLFLSKPPPSLSLASTHLFNRVTQSSDKRRSSSRAPCEREEGGSLSARAAAERDRREKTHAPKQPFTLPATFFSRSPTRVPAAEMRDHHPGLTIVHCRSDLSRSKPRPLRAKFASCPLQRARQD